MAEEKKKKKNEKKEEGGAKMDVRALFMCIVAAVAAFFVQRELGLLTGVMDSITPAGDTIIFSYRVVTPDGVMPAAVHVKEGRITKVVRSDTAPDLEQVVNYGHWVVSPGVVDVHVHLNEPGREEWEGFDTGTKAAAAGGVTTVVDMPLNSHPTTVDAAAFDLKLAASKGKLHVDVAFWGGLVPANAHNETTLKELIDRGVVGFKTFMSPSGIGDFENTERGDLEAALKVLKKHDMPLMAHAELPGDVELDPDADPRKYATYLATRPRKWEQDAIKILTELATKSGAPIHIAHVSDADSLEMVKEARAAGKRITAETCPHYLFFAAEEIKDGKTQYKCAPPIREKENRDRLWKGIEDGVISIVSSDHSPAPPELKKFEEGDFLAAWGGISGLQFTLPATWTKGSKLGMDFMKLAEILSTAPAKMVGLKAKGSIARGKDADFAIWDPEHEFFPGIPSKRSARIEHKHRLTPYNGQIFNGRVMATYVRGERVFATHHESGAHAFRTPLDEPYGQPLLRK